ncbi:inositol oxygenase [Streptomyces sp. SCSIO ZS0520]|uniref:inositol oxygenase n=1 Tax=Streptomyces sp. SCSIO ZS0520 TaxID=2892996 RepID=UPI0021DAD15B|nr:inositol oxygenase [Streptomyces sp. SCSIO ZS0520]
MEPLSVEELMELLDSCRGLRIAAGDRGGPVDLHEHALQTAALLRRSHPSDKELQVAGLVHGIGHALRPGEPNGHADLAAEAVRELLGLRVARLVRERPGAEPAPDALTLHQAGAAARAAALDAGVLEDWRPVLELVAARQARPGGRHTP